LGSFVGCQLRTFESGFEHFLLISFHFLQSALRYTKGAKVAQSQYEKIPLREEEKRALNLVILPDNTQSK
jgi:hypothetical protein